MQVSVTRANAMLKLWEPLTVGMSKAVPVVFSFSPEWDGISKVAVFTAGTTQIDVLDTSWASESVCFVPPEVLTTVGDRVNVGVYGTDADNAVVIPTVWVNLGRVQPAPDPSGDPTTDPTLPVWAQLQGQLIDSAEVDANGDLIIKLHSGTELNAGYVIGPQGPAGIGAEIIDFAATLTDWDTMDAASTDVPFADIVQKVQDGAASARLALTVDGTTYNVNLQGFSVGNAVSFYGIGQIPETLRIISLLGAEGYWFAATETLGGGTSDYDQLSNRPQINGNTLTGNKTAAQLGLGTYSKPSGGIPKADLASAVQTSLGKADSALQTAPVSSVNGQTGAVVLGASDVGAATENYVDSAISQSTAFYRGNFATRTALLAVAWQTTNPQGANYVTNNDYAVVLDDETQNDECWRYIYVTGSGWTAQYRINETPLTQAQLDALNSGATTAKINQIAANTTAISGKITAPASPASGAFLVWDGSAWVAQTLSVWQGGSY